MKNADNLSIETPNFKMELSGRLRTKVLPNITDHEKMIPKMDAINELMNDAYVTRRSFLCQTIDKAPPIKYVKISPKNKNVETMNSQRNLLISAIKLGYKIVIMNCIGHSSFF